SNLDLRWLPSIGYVSINDELLVELIVFERFGCLSRAPDAPIEGCALWAHLWATAGQVNNALALGMTSRPREVPAELNGLRLSAPKLVGGVAVQVALGHAERALEPLGAGPAGADLASQAGADLLAATSSNQSSKWPNRQSRTPTGAARPAKRDQPESLGDPSVGFTLDELRRVQMTRGRKPPKSPLEPGTRPLPYPSNRCRGGPVPAEDLAHIGPLARQVLPTGRHLESFTRTLMDTCKCQTDLEKVRAAFEWVGQADPARAGRDAEGRKKDSPLDILARLRGRRNFSQRSSSESSLGQRIRAEPRPGASGFAVLIDGECDSSTRTGAAATVSGENSGDEDGGVQTSTRTQGTVVYSCKRDLLPHRPVEDDFKHFPERPGVAAAAGAADQRYQFEQLPYLFPDSATPSNFRAEADQASQIFGGVSGRGNQLQIEVYPPKPGKVPVGAAGCTAMVVGGGGGGGGQMMDLVHYVLHCIGASDFVEQCRRTKRRVGPAAPSGRSAWKRTSWSELPLRAWSSWPSDWTTALADYEPLDGFDLVHVVAPGAAGSAWRSARRRRSDKEKPIRAGVRLPAGVGGRPPTARRTRCRRCALIGRLACPDEARRGQAEGYERQAGAEVALFNQGVDVGDGTSFGCALPRMGCHLLRLFADADDSSPRAGLRRLERTAGCLSDTRTGLASPGLPSGERRPGRRIGAGLARRPTGPTRRRRVRDLGEVNGENVWRVRGGDAISTGWRLLDGRPAGRGGGSRFELRCGGQALLSYRVLTEAELRRGRRPAGKRPRRGIGAATNRASSGKPSVSGGAQRHDGGRREGGREPQAGRRKKQIDRARQRPRSPAAGSSTTVERGGRKSSSSQVGIAGQEVGSRSRSRSRSESSATNAAEGRARAVGGRKEAAGGGESRDERKARKREERTEKRELKEYCRGQLLDALRRRRLKPLKRAMTSEEENKFSLNDDLFYIL
uniref:Protein kinase domain-containing protein n=1 Tax=Macrostomum lignano TaxID=282301 RepID=A0A1I8FDN4_9PLAT